MSKELELADEAAGVGGGIAAALEVVGAQVDVVDAEARMCQIETSSVWATAKAALDLPFLPKRRTKRRN